MAPPPCPLRISWPPPRSRPRGCWISGKQETPPRIPSPPWLRRTAPMKPPRKTAASMRMPTGTAWMPPSPTGSLPRGVRLGTPLWWRARTAVGTSPATRCFTWRALARSSGSTRPPAPCARKTTTSGTKTCRPNIPQSSPKRERPSPHCNHLPRGGITLPRGFFRRHPHGS